MKTMIAIPAMEQMYSWTAQCLANLRHVGECKTEYIVRMQVDMARNVLAQRAIEGGYDRILWIDSDMTFEPDMMERLSDDLEAGWDMVTGLYFKRTFPLEPVIYSHIEEAKAELNGVTLESLVVAERVARAVRISGEKGLLDLKDFPLLTHIDEIITDKKPVNIPWNAFVFEK